MSEHPGELDALPLADLLATERLRALLGDRYDDVMRSAALAVNLPRGGCNCDTCADDAAASTLAAVLPDLLATAWDEGHWLGKADAALNAVRVDGTHIRTPNPYRTEPQPSVTRCASCDCLKPCDRMLDPEETR